MNHEDKSRSPFEVRARELFQGSIESLDATERSRLARARREAVAAAPGRRFSSWLTWVPAASLAAAVLVAVLLHGAGSSGGPVASQPVADDAALGPVEMLADSEAFGLAENDPAFYQWLDAGGLESDGGTG